jgi:hypothetical protein
MTTTVGTETHQSQQGFAAVTSRLAADADDAAAQVAFAIESIADEVAQLMGELAALREAVNEERVLLDELREAVVVPARARHVRLGNPRLSLLPVRTRK